MCSIDLNGRVYTQATTRQTSVSTVERVVEGLQHCDNSFVVRLGWTQCYHTWRHATSTVRQSERDHSPHQSWRWRRSRSLKSWFCNSKLTWLIGREDLDASILRESFKSYRTEGRVVYAPHIVMSCCESKNNKTDSALSISLLSVCLWTIYGTLPSHSLRIVDGRYDRSDINMEEPVCPNGFRL
jgi:hypothetical protein